MLSFRFLRLLRALFSLSVTKSPSPSLFQVQALPFAARCSSPAAPSVLCARVFFALLKCAGRDGCCSGRRLTLARSQPSFVEAGQHESGRSGGWVGFLYSMHCKLFNSVSCIWLACAHLLQISRIPAPVSASKSRGLTVRGCKPWGTLVMRRPACRLNIVDLDAHLRGRLRSVHVTQANYFVLHCRILLELVTIGDWLLTSCKPEEYVRTKQGTFQLQQAHLLAHLSRFHFPVRGFLSMTVE